MSKRRDLTAAGKLELLQSYDRLPPMSKRRAAGELNISHSTLANILKERSTIELAALENENLNRKRKRCGKDKNVERALKEWFLEARESDYHINGRILMKKAEELAVKIGVQDFKATDGWFCRWKKRENVCLKPYGKQGDGIQEGANSWLRTTWLELLTRYAPGDVFNADETVLYFNSQPEHTVGINGKAKEKANEQQLTVLCCASMLGEKKKLLVVGRSDQTLGIMDDRKLPIDYARSSNAALTSQIFNDWLLQWDKTLTHDILLLMDDLPAHKINENFSYIKTVFLPASTTSHVQPCDHGIIRVMKAHYQREIRKIVLAATDQVLKNGISLRANGTNKEISLLDALHLVHKAWSTVPDETISNCFRDTEFNRAGMQEEAPIKTSSEFSKEPYEEMEIDCDPPVTERLTGEGIDSTILKGTLGKDSDDGEMSPPPPTPQEMLDALQVLRSGLQHRAQDFEPLDVFEQYVRKILDEGNNTQSRIPESFPKQ